MGEEEQLAMAEAGVRLVLPVTVRMPKEERHFGRLMEGEC